MKNEILGAKAPEKGCTDKKCPFHGTINVKDELFKGVVIKTDINHTATITWQRPVYIPKYERYEMRTSRLRVHNPVCFSAKVGQVVLAARSRPLSKTKHHVIIKIFESNEGIKPAKSAEKGASKSADKKTRTGEKVREEHQIK